jgi:hypothetical protein
MGQLEFFGGSDRLPEFIVVSFTKFFSDCKHNMEKYRSWSQPKLCN